MAKLSGYRKLVKWIRVGDDFKKTSTETRAESVIMDDKDRTLKEEMSDVKKYSIAENLIPYPYKDTTMTRNGITWTDNGDGTITVNGTATATESFYTGFRNYQHTNLIEGVKYTFSGCPVGGTKDTYYLEMISFDEANAHLYGYGHEYGEGKLARARDDEGTSLDVCFRLVVKAGVTVNNLTFKPMLEVGTIAHEYQPYNLSRKSLRDDLDNIELTADKVSFDKGDTTLTSTNVEDALKEVFQYGNNRHAELVDSLQYSGLGITDSSSWDDINDKLAAAFPQTYNVLSDLRAINGYTHIPDTHFDGEISTSNSVLSILSSTNKEQYSVNTTLTGTNRYNFANSYRLTFNATLKIGTEGNIDNPTGIGGENCRATISVCNSSGVIKSWEKTGFSNIGTYNEILDFTSNSEVWVKIEVFAQTIYTNSKLIINSMTLQAK